MTKKIFLIVFCFIVINITMKGDDLERTENDSLVRIVLKENDRKSNWFLSLGTGVNTHLNNNGSSTPLRKRITLNYNFAAVKWISPIFGLRFALTGGKIHAPSINDLQGMNSITYFNAHADLLFNFTNYVLPSLTRKYNLVPNMGIGYTRGDNESPLFGSNGFNGPTINVGLLNTYRISNRISAYIELGMSLVESRFDKVKEVNTNNNNWSEIVNLNAGISISLGKTGLKEIVLQDLSELAMLNKAIDRLREENNEFVCRRPLPCPPVQDCPPPPIGNYRYLGCLPVNVVFFLINSSEVLESQLITLYNYSELLKSDKKLQMKLIGYADKETGSKTYNLKLSQKRAENVANVLVNKYGIERDRLMVESKGSSEQPYKDNKWNRAVILLVDDE